jgi:hypothetical protein
MNLQQIPPPTGVRQTKLRDGACVLLEEVAALCAKFAVEPLSPSIPGDQGYYSTYFLVPKKDGGVRPILNLKPFNKYLNKQRFKMETLPKVFSALPRGAWMASLDLKDAYFHVPVAAEHRQYLRFAIAGQRYQYRVAPFGLALAPLIFTRVVFSVIAWLRVQGVHVHAYLDDMLIVAPTPEHLSWALRVTLQTLLRAGFTINLRKSDLNPSQDLVYIGGRLRTDLERVFLPPERVSALKRVIMSFSRVGKYHAVRQWLKVLGLMAATISSVHLARLRMRPLQLHLREQWRSRNLEAAVMVPRHLLPCLRWWAQEENLTQGMPFRAPPHALTITTDASREGWGGHLTLGEDNLLWSGLWTPTERRDCHINLLELRAIKLCLLRALPHVRGLVVRVECDNTTAIAYLNRQGGTRSPSLCREACALHEWLLLHQVIAHAIHRPGVDNQLADFLSRNRPDPTEWSLADRMCRRIWEVWGTPQVDLFASQSNYKLPVWFGRMTGSSPSHLDAFAHSWAGLRVYVFPPLNLVQRTLLKLQADGVEDAIVIAPYWPKRTWFPLLQSMAVEAPWILPVERDLLSQRLPDKGILFHPDLHSLRLAAWRLSVHIG